MNLKHLATFTTVLAVSFLQLSCTTIPRNIEKPDVALESVDIDQVNLTDATVLVKLDVRNPNPFELSMDSMEYTLQLDGQPFAKGRTYESASVPANGEAKLVLPLRFKVWNLYSQYKNLMKNRSTHYEINGSITTWTREIPFKHTGDFKLPES